MYINACSIYNTRYRNVQRAGIKSGATSTKSINYYKKKKKTQNNKCYVNYNCCGSRSADIIVTYAFRDKSPRAANEHKRGHSLLHCHQRHTQHKHTYIPTHVYKHTHTNHSRIE